MRPVQQDFYAKTCAAAKPPNYDVIHDPQVQLMRSLVA